MSRTTVIVSDSLEMNSESTLCRLCIKNNESCFSIFTSNVTCEMPVKDVLQDLVGLQVALGDGLPGVICPLCLKKLMEFRDFKRICFESDAELRKCPSRNCFKSIKEERTADDNMGSSAETKECIQDTIEGTSQFACSVQRTEIFIPLENCQLPQANMLSNVKEENEQLFSEGNYPAFNSPNTAGISSEASDPLATHDLCTVKEENEQLLSEGNYPAFNSPNTVGISSEASDPLATHDLPTFTKDENLIDDWKMTNDSTAEATGLSTPDKVLMETTPTSCMLKGRNVRIDVSNDCIAPSISVKQFQSKAVGFHVENGRNVIDRDFEERNTLHADEITYNSIPDYAQSYKNHIPASKNSGNSGATMTVVGGIGDAPNITDSLRLIRIGESRRSGIEAVMEDKEEISNCQIKNPSSSFKSNEKLYHCSHCRYRFNTNDDLIKHMEIHFGASNLNLNDESFIGKDESLTVPASREESSNSCESSTTSETLIGLKRKREGPMQKVKTPVTRISGGMGEKKTVERMRSSGGDGKQHTKNKSSKSTSCASNLQNHEVGGTKGWPFNCRLCNKSFTLRGSFANHMYTHTGKKHPCGICSKSFATKAHLTQHMPTHTGEKPYSCRICSKPFRQRSHLTDHIRSHSGEKPFTCNDCNKSFTRKSILIRHLRTHTGEKRFSCKTCRKCFIQSAHLASHLQTHSGESPFSCSDCAKSFSTKSTLMVHQRLHKKEKPYSCSYCAKSFPTKSRLTVHLRSHTGEKPFSCDYCANSFTRKDTLIQHLPVHTGEKPFSCNICDKSFSRKNILTKHVRTHAEEKPYS
ncbi:zinc finger protein 235-like [Ischnura elegans]|uniref:zinc finger protein 235-like n=1 Tax=Ischnura elegans TaxID=197161 RepID=UPI001ED8804A|nr:zinc finger protein 235-like [Ischnura elegans]